MCTVKSGRNANMGLTRTVHLATLSTQCKTVLYLLFNCTETVPEFFNLNTLSTCDRTAKSGYTANV
jgi:hypothetical protein